MKYIEQLANLMQETGISCMHFKDKIGAGGTIDLQDSKLSYKHGWKYYTEDEYAYHIAFLILKQDIEDINLFREIQSSNKAMTTKVNYVDFDNKQYNHEEDMNKYAWKSDIKDSGVRINEDGSITGTIDQLRKFLSLASNHGRYCRSTYKYESETVVRLMTIGSNYELYKPYDSFDEYYHGGTVD